MEIRIDKNDSQKLCNESVTSKVVSNNISRGAQGRYEKTHIQPLLLGLPEGFEAMDQRDLFASLREAGEDWSVFGIVDAINEILVDEEFARQKSYNLESVGTLSKDTVDKWLFQDKKPSGNYRLAFSELLRRKGGEFAEEWLIAFTKMWMNRAVDKLQANKKKSEQDQFISELQSYCLEDRQLTHLPSLFGAEKKMPVASAYVDLSVAESAIVSNSSSHLHTSKSLAERINERRDRRYAIRRSPKELFDRPGSRAMLMLGDPGSGKSSLLKHIGLNIASGEWKNSDVPIFMEVRSYWLHRQQNPNLSLLEYSLSKFKDLTELSFLELRKLLFPVGVKHTPGLLLIDGLDEIANSAKAVQIIYDELRSLTSNVPWVVSCRPAGLVSTIGEILRCELTEIDEESIENLVRNWCAFANLDGGKLDVDVYLQEIFGSSSNREMARNPFLLTALCFLKTQAPEQELPTTRIAVYSELVDRIGEQARRSNEDKNILKPNHLNALEEFCFHLYENKEVQQIFSRQDWEEFSGKEESEIIDFDQSILPARLLTSWDVGIERFHFVHLTLQEFLVAKAMLLKGTDYAAEKRFHPAWRSIFRFYGALLYSSGKTDEFRDLVVELYKNSDFTGYTFLTVSEIFSDLGIRDTTEWLGEDLRERLYHVSLTSNGIAAEALIDALIVLDPAWLETKAKERLDHRLSLVTDKAPNEILLVDGLSVDSPYQLLARTRTSRACRIIRETFFGEDHEEADAAAEAFALIATKLDRDKAVEKLVSNPSNLGFVTPFISFVDASRRSEFLPALIAIMDWCKQEGKEELDEYNTAASAISLIGGPEPTGIFERMLNDAVKKKSIDEDELQDIFHWLAQAGGESSVEILNNFVTLPKLSTIKRRIEISSVYASPSQKHLVEELLEDDAEASELMQTLANAADLGRIVDQEICSGISKAFENSSELDIFDISVLEENRIKAGQKPALCGTILSGLPATLEKISAASDSEERQEFLAEYAFAIDALEIADWKPAKEFSKAMIFDTNHHTQVMQSNVRLTGKMFEGTGDKTIIDQLLRVWFSAAEDFCDFCGAAVGQIDINVLFQFRSAHGAAAALEQIAATNDLLVFEDFHSDRFGKKNYWHKAPNGILYLVPASDPADSANLAHELSRYGFCAMFEDHKRCVAVFVFSEEDNWCREELDAFLANEEWKSNINQSDANKKRPVIYVPKNIDLQNPEEYARQIAEQLGVYSPII